MIQTTPTFARRLAIHKQRLTEPQLTADSAGILETIRALGCVQLDPLRRVERSPLLVLWSRLGNYDHAHLEQLLWQDKQLFEYWAHAASIVLTENYALHQGQMRHFARSGTVWNKRIRDWLDANEPFRQYILERLADEPFVAQKDIEDRSVTDWQSGGWTAGRRVERMVSFMWEQGDLMVGWRKGLQRHWTLAEKHLPQIAGISPLTDEQITTQAIQIALRALGVATIKQIKAHFIRNHYPGLAEILPRLVQQGRIHPITVCENGQTWPGDWFIHADDMPALEAIQNGKWQPRTTLLSPFDNLLCDRDRTELMWDFHFRIEIYVPAAKRKFGYYVLPILHGDKLIGRLDPKMDRKTKTLHVFNVYAEKEAAAEAAAGIRASLEDLAAFLGANKIEIGEVPAIWSSLK